MSKVLYRVERMGSEDLGFPVELDTALLQVRARAPKEDEGALRIVRVEYDLDPARPSSGVFTKAMLRVWRATVVRFPSIGQAGTYVCKANSQHRYGNATDWQAPDTAKSTDQIIDYLWKVFSWQKQQGRLFASSNAEEGLPVAELIFRDRIATRAIDDFRERSYTGPFHASHVHTSCYPLIDTSRPCG